MIVKNRLDMSFGPVGAVTGKVILILGVLSLSLTWHLLVSIITILVGALIGLTYSCTMIDFEKRQIRSSNQIFGFIKTGFWMNIEPDMKIGVKKSKQTWRTYTNGMQSFDISQKDHLLVLCNSQGNVIMPIKKLQNLEMAKSELETICKQLELSAITKYDVESNIRAKARTTRR